MLLRQYYLGCLSQASYLVGDEEAGVAAIVDPRRDVDAYLEEAPRSTWVPRGRRTTSSRP